MEIEEMKKKLMKRLGRKQHIRKINIQYSILREALIWTLKNQS